MSASGPTQVMRTWERLAGAVSFLAGILHAAAGPSHYAEWWAYGLFFYGAAAAQMVFGIILGTQGVEARGGWDAVRRRFYVLGIAGNLAIMALWLVTRLVAIPFGPEAGERESIGLLDGISKTVETVLVVLLARLLVATRPTPPGPAR